VDEVTRLQVSQITLGYFRKENGMQYKLMVFCRGCDGYIGVVEADTADMPEALQERINTKVLAHRPKCSAYSQESTAVVNGD